jgi:FtsP/CotA-like multicopper oxidase with cupredoxin domain
MGSKSKRGREREKQGRRGRLLRGAMRMLAAGLLMTGATVTAAPEEQGLSWSWPTWPWSRPAHRDMRDVHQSLVVQYSNHRLCAKVEQGRCKAWDTVKLRSYNGRLVGPTIEVWPGDTLYISLDNQLPQEPMSAEHDPNVPHGFNTTNIHTHGLHVSPAGNSDNVAVAVGPGQKFQYEIKIPADHPAGTYWYHPHKHGSTTIQVGSGMAGALIVRGDIDRVPAIRAAREQVFVFQQIPYALIDDPYEPGRMVNMVERFDAFAPGRWRQSGRRTTINGVVEPTLRMRPGEVQRWRFIHAGPREPLQLKLIRENDPRSVLSQYQIAHDGITTGRLDEVDMTELHPGYRVDVMVKAGPTRETLLLVDTAGLAPGEAPRVLARVSVEGWWSTSMQLPRPEQLAKLAPMTPIADDELTGTQTVVFDLDVRFNPPKFLINGKPFDPKAPPRRLPLEGVEEWTVSSTRFSGHPFHIHVNHFQVMTKDGKVLWKDTLFVKANETVKLRTRYERYIGKFLMHCHILDHGDLGMMEYMEIVPPSSADDHHH